MSGFEVAGVVLGSIPLLVSAVEAYIKFMRDWGKSELKSLNRQLTTERTKLYNVLEQLLGDKVPQRDIEPMLQDPMGPLWQAKETNDKIRRMLWNSYAPFEETVLEIRDAVEDVMARLQVQVTSDGQVSPFKYTSVGDFPTDSHHRLMPHAGQMGHQRAHDARVQEVPVPPGSPRLPRCTRHHR
jgi:hypothetical protein